MLQNQRQSLPLTSEIIQEYRAFHASDPSFDYSVGMHYHEHYEVLLHLKGGTRFVVGPSTYEMAPYDVYIIPPFRIHGILADVPLRDYERAWIHITGDYLDSLGAGMVSFDRILDHLGTADLCRFPLSPKQFGEFLRRIDEVRNLSDDASPYSRMKVRLSLGSFFNDLCHTLRDEPLPAESASGHPLVHEVFNYIAEHCTEDLTLDFLASRFNVSKYYLSHIFSRVFNVSIYRYTLLCRIAMAQKLILSEENLTGISQRCGFNDYSNFLRAFSQITGTTPSAYRKRILDNAPAAR